VFHRRTGRHPADLGEWTHNLPQGRGVHLQRGDDLVAAMWVQRECPNAISPTSSVGEMAPKSWTIAQHHSGRGGQPQQRTADPGGAVGENDACPGTGTRPLPEV
jgi:hypothetical protein